METEKTDVSNAAKMAMDEMGVPDAHKAVNDVILRLAKRFVALGIPEYDVGEPVGGAHVLAEKIVSNRKKEALTILCKFSLDVRQAAAKELQENEDIHNRRAAEKHATLCELYTAVVNLSGVDAPSVEDILAKQPTKTPVAVKNEGFNWFAEMATEEKQRSIPFTTARNKLKDLICQFAEHLEALGVKRKPTDDDVPSSRTLAEHILAGHKIKAHRMMQLLPSEIRMAVAKEMQDVEGHTASEWQRWSTEFDAFRKALLAFTEHDIALLKQYGDIRPSGWFDWFSEPEDLDTIIYPVKS